MPDPSLIERAFSADRAEGYDREFERLAAIKDLLHLLLRIRFSELPDDARILVAGAGTGAEVRFLAPLFPGWRFTLADPAEGMLAVAERHANAEGFADRCVFHTGYVSSLPVEPHDAATSILVSQFLTNAGERQGYFEDIARRLRPGGLLFNADLAADRDAPSFEGTMDLWLAMMQYAAEGRGDASASHGERPSFREMFGKVVGAHDPVQVEGLIRQAGFENVVPCFQAVLIRAWLATRAPSEA